MAPNQPSGRPGNTNEAFLLKFVYLSIYCILYMCICTGERNVLFSDSVIKVNRRGRTQERWLMITGENTH